MKMDLDRRTFLTGTTGALSLSLLPLKLLATATSKPVPAAPVARVEVVKDTYFGETLSDPYRWMENDKDRDWLPFLKGQNEHTRAVLDRASQAATALLKRIQQLSGRQPSATARVQRAGGLTFIRAAAVGRRQLQAVRAGSTMAASRVLVDPTAQSQRHESRLARLVARLARRHVRGVRPVEGRQRGFGSARPQRRRRQRSPRADRQHRGRPSAMAR